MKTNIFTNTLLDHSSMHEESTWNVNVNGTKGKLTITLANSIIF
jgi:hypothetical protein